VDLRTVPSMPHVASHPHQSQRWNVEIHLSPGGIVWERTLAKDPQEAVEAALARSYILPAHVNGIAAYPVASPAPA
jgi:hypothetical protein